MLLDVVFPHMGNDSVLYVFGWKNYNFFTLDDANYLLVLNPDNQTVVLSDELI